MKSEKQIRTKIAELEEERKPNEAIINILRWVLEAKIEEEEEQCYVSRKPKFKHEI